MMRRSWVSTAGVKGCAGASAGTLKAAGTPHSRIGTPSITRAVTPSADAAPGARIDYRQTSWAFE
jgi:hypothetical protein